MGETATATLDTKIDEKTNLKKMPRKTSQKTTKKAVDTREQALEDAIAQIERSFGRGAVMRMSENDGNQNIASISTGSLSLDIALGTGGLPKGREIGRASCRERV